MHSIYSNQSTIAYGTPKNPNWIYVKNGLLANLKTVIEFYRKNPMAVQSNHFLVKLLQSITIPQSQHIERYYNNVDALSLNLSMALKMTSSIFKGHLFDGVFLGKNNYELLIAHSDGFNPNEAHSNWKNLRPVEFLSHQRSDLGLNLPDGINTGVEEGLAVYVIDIPLLAIQYRAFRINERLLNSIDTSKSVMQFIHMYVLPNMLYSYLDHAIFNRISALELGKPFGESKKQHSFFLTDYSDKITHVQIDILNLLKKENKTFDGMLKSIPMIVKNNADDLMALPDIALTRQCLWSLVLSRLPELLFLVKLSKESIGNKNQSEVNRIVRYFQNYKSDNLFRTMLPIDLYLNVADIMNEVERLVK